MKIENTVNGVILLLIATISWGGMFIIAESTLKVIDPFYMTLIRYGSATIVFSIILFFEEGKKSFSFEEGKLKLFFLGSLGFAGASLFSLAGLMHTSAENGAVIMATQPLLTVIVLWVWKGIRPAGFTIVLILIAFTGIVLVITNGKFHSRLVLKSFYGDFLMFCGALSWIIYTIGNKAYSHWSPMRYTTLTCLLGMITIVFLTTIVTFTHYIHFFSLAALSLIKWKVFYIVFVASIVVVLFWNKGIKKIGPLNGILFINFIPVTVFLITSLQGTPIEKTKLIGAALVIFSLIANNFFHKVKLSVSVS